MGDLALPVKKLDNTGTLPQIFADWFLQKEWQPHSHQLEMVAADAGGRSCLLIAPTGAGKTLAGFLPSLINIVQNPSPGLHTIYISPLKALATDIERNLAAPIAEMNLPVRIETRTGDTASSRRQRQMKSPPHILLTTPESLELILSYPEARQLMSGLQRIIIDEVHALAPGKRGHLTALCLARLRIFSPKLKVCGLSATVAAPAALAKWLHPEATIITAPQAIAPKIRLLQTGKVPWSGYMANYAVMDIYRAITQANTSIVFVNTRAQAEFLFQKLWEANNDGLPIALHHGSLDRDHRKKVETLMAKGGLRAIIATASLDLGLDWAAVDLVIQVGAPKGISRLLQRIGRSNHRLDKPSDALLVPCNRFEMVECITVIDAIQNNIVDGEPLQRGTLDVLAQFVMNCAAAGGFTSKNLYGEIIQATPYDDLDVATFDRIVQMVANGGYSLRAYDRFQRITQDTDGVWHASPSAIKRHRMNTGTIVEYETLRVSLQRRRSPFGRDLGLIEEYFIQGLTPGDTFIFAGQLLRYKTTRDDTVEVELATGDQPKIPSFKGGRLPLSPSLAAHVQDLMSDPSHWSALPPVIGEWLSLQRERSSLPDKDCLLAETFAHQGLHYFVCYSFAGRNANQTLGLLLSQQMEASALLPLGFVANDYAVAFWGLAPILKPQHLINEGFSQPNTSQWIEGSQMAKRAFRDIAVISGLVERRHPGKKKTGRQVTMSTDLIYDVLRNHEPDHILLHATRREVLGKLTDIDRLRDMIEAKPIKHRILAKISPLAVPLILEIGIEKIKGKAEFALLDSLAREIAGDKLLEEAAGSWDTV